MAAFVVGHIMAIITFPAQCGVIHLIVILFTQDPAGFIVRHEVISICGSFRNHLEIGGIEIAFCELVTQFIIGVHCLSITHLGIDKVIIRVEIRLLRHKSQCVIGGGLLRIAAADIHQFSFIIVIGNLCLTSGKVVNIPGFRIIAGVIGGLTLFIKEAYCQNATILIHFPGHGSITSIVMERRFSATGQQALLYAMVPLIIGKQDLAVSISAPDQLTVLVVVGLPGFIVIVVIFITNRAVAAGQLCRLTVNIQIFTLRYATTSIPRVPQGSISARTGYRLILIIEESLGQDISILIHFTADAGVSGTDVGSVILIVQVDGANKIQVLVIDKLTGCIAILEQSGLSGNIQISCAPDFTLVAVLIPNACITAGDHDVQSISVQVFHSCTPVVFIILILNGSVTESGLNSLETGIQILCTNQASAVIK